jgi:hypothetical protein
MSDVLIIVWFTWFLATNWLQPFGAFFKERITKGVKAMKRTLTLIFPLFLGAAIFLGLSAITVADDDPPSRVAPLSYMQGSVSYQPSGETDWVDANPNRPLTTGDNLWVDKNSRGEVHIGSTSEPPPAGGDKSAEMPAHGNDVPQQPPPAQKLDQHPAVKFTPPPKQEERRAEPPPKQESHPAPIPKEKEKEKESKPPRGWR